jgi:hypothetical protein
MSTPISEITTSALRLPTPGLVSSRVAGSSKEDNLRRHVSDRPYT